MLPQFGIGLTDIAKTASGMDKELPVDALGRAACAAMEAKIRACAPAILAFTSLTAGRRYLRRGGFRRAAGDDRRDPRLAAAVAVAGGQLELGGQA